MKGTTFAHDASANVTEMLGHVKYSVVFHNAIRIAVLGLTTKFNSMNSVGGKRASFIPLYVSIRLKEKRKS